MKHTTITFHTSISKSLEQRWDRLWENSETSNVFNSRKWFDFCRKTFKVREFVIVTLEENKRLKAVLPLTPDNKMGMKLLSSPGRSYIDRSSLLTADYNPNIVRKLLTKLSKKSGFYLYELAQEHTESVKNKEYLTIIPASVCPYMQISKDPLTNLSPKNQKKLLNTIKRNSDKLSFKSFAGNAEALDTAIALDLESYKLSQGKATFTSEENIHYYKQLLEAYQDDFLVNIVFYDDEPIVYDIGLIDRDSYHGINTSYREEFKKLMPGRLLVYYLNFALKKKKVKTLYMGRGTNEMKREFTPLFKQQYTVYQTGNIIAQHWVLTAHKGYNKILESKLLYEAYCKVRRLFYS